MNIKQAREYIKNTVSLYLKKDDHGEYRVPLVRQRPVFLLGAPGIGKTAIVEQIAQEMGIALVSYSMTHHTRQSALGLPFITEKDYGGTPCRVSEYTMSEIIASVYDAMESGGIEEGILFLDEINCVSETLAPAMLQFLQYKTFGRHRIPEGWVVVTAGNPPEYNKSVREFDIATLDRLKVMEVEPDYYVWKEYAVQRRIHNAVTSYLDLKKEHFYRIETTPRGRSYVTGRGWEDLSEILKLHEEESLPVDEALVGQYLRNEEIVKEFTSYYDLYLKYKRDYRIPEILEGRAPASAVERAGRAAFDERLSLLGMLTDRVCSDMEDVMEQTELLAELKKALKGISGTPETESAEQTVLRLETMAQDRRKLLERRKNANSLSEQDRRKYTGVIRFLEEFCEELRSGADAGGSADLFLREKYNARVTETKEQAAKAGERLHALFAFAEEAFGEGNEMLILVTELTRSRGGAGFIAAFGSPDYSRHSRELMLSERREDIMARIAGLDLDGAGRNAGTDIGDAAGIAGSDTGGAVRNAGTDIGDAGRNAGTDIGDAGRNAGTDIDSAAPVISGQV